VQHKQTEAGKNHVSFVIRLPLHIVHRSIYLDHEAGAMAVEIDDETIDDLLTAKVQSSEPVRPQALP
jgi:hypothetical protein